MSSTANPLDPERRGHIRRALRRITTTFRRADGQHIDLDAEVPACSPLADNAHVEQRDECCTNESTGGQSQVHNAPLLAATASNDALIAADDTAEDCLSTLDPSMQMPDAFIHGEWTLDRAAAHTDRSQRLLSRYGVDIQPHDNMSSNASPVVHRVQRAPRMRVHRACHQCGVEFNHHKKCRACGHDICKRCPRSEGRRVRAVLDAERQTTQTSESSRVAVAGPSQVDTDQSHMADAPSDRTTKRDISPSMERGLLAHIGTLPLSGPAPNAAWPETLEVDEEQKEAPECQSGNSKGKGRMVSQNDLRAREALPVWASHRASRRTTDIAPQPIGDETLPQEAVLRGVTKLTPDDDNVAPFEHESHRVTGTDVARSSPIPSQQDRATYEADTSSTILKAEQQEHRTTNMSESTQDTAYALKAAEHECQAIIAFAAPVMSTEGTTNVSISPVHVASRSSVHYVPLSTATRAQGMCHPPILPRHRRLDKQPY